MYVWMLINDAPVNLGSLVRLTKPIYSLTRSGSAEKACPDLVINCHWPLAGYLLAIVYCFGQENRPETQESILMAERRWALSLQEVDLPTSKEPTGCRLLATS